MFSHFSQTASPPGSEVLRPRVASKPLGNGATRPRFASEPPGDGALRPRVALKPAGNGALRPRFTSEPPDNRFFAELYYLNSSPVIGKIPKGEWGQYGVKTREMRGAA